jgi:hypothetical protein
MENLPNVRYLPGISAGILDNVYAPKFTENFFYHLWFIFIQVVNRKEGLWGGERGGGLGGGFLRYRTILFS